MRFGGRPKEVGQCSYRVAKQLQPGLPPKLIHTALLKAGWKARRCRTLRLPLPRSSRSARHYGAPVAMAAESGRRPHPAHVEHWSSLPGSRWGACFRGWPTLRLCPWSRCIALANPFGWALDPKRTASGQPFRLSSDQSSQPFGCASGQDASRWPTTSVVPVIKSAPRPADSATRLALTSGRPFRLRLPTTAVVLASYYSCACQLL